MAAWAFSRAISASSLPRAQCGRSRGARDPPLPLARGADSLHGHGLGDRRRAHLDGPLGIAACFDRLELVEILLAASATATTRSDGPDTHRNRSGPATEVSPRSATTCEASAHTRLCGAHEARPLLTPTGTPRDRLPADNRSSRITSCARCDGSSPAVIGLARVAGRSGPGTRFARWGCELRARCQPDSRRGHGP
jgi:hypothetical protein